MATEDRRANLLGALVLTLGDAIRDATEAVSVRGAMAPAALTTIAAYPGESLDALRRTLRLTPSGATRLIDSLEHDALVERRAGRDGRSIALFVTRQGAASAATILKARRTALREALRCLSSKDQVLFERLLEKLLYGLTPNREKCDHICRLCEIAACPQGTCPVESAAVTKDPSHPPATPVA